MARKPRRKYRRYLRGRFDDTITLTTLASKTVAAEDISDSVTEEAWVSSVRANHTLDNFTDAASVGPIMVGWAHSDYTAAEIEEWVENLSSWETGDLVAQEVAKRKIRQVGVFESAQGGSVDDISVINDGKPITTKLGFMLATGQTLKQWAYNMGASPIGATAPNYRVVGHANLWPK